MDSFSWSDRIHALGLSSCLSCLSSSSLSNDNQQPSDTLQGLLSESISDGETLSLHSNLGERRRQKKRTSKGISLFGYNLFGRAPPVHLDGGDDVLVAPRPRRRALSAAGTLDADAAPLDTAAIEARAAEEMRRQKEERRKRRRERRALKEAARTLASRGEGAEEFEGFPGSGSSPYPIPPPFNPSQPLPLPRIPGLDDEDEDEADADLGGELYVRTALADGGSNGSDSRSRTSASLSSSGVSHAAPQMPRSSTYMEPAAPTMPKKKRSKKSRSSTTTSQSRSLASPPPFEQTFAVTPAIASPSFEGFPGDNLAPQTPQDAFPSTGLGGRKANGEAGAFLARSGL